MEQRFKIGHIGYAINAQQLFNQLNIEKLKIDGKYLGAKYKLNKRGLARKLFSECYDMVMRDVIENNDTFTLPGKLGSAEIRMKTFEGEEFQRVRQYGKFDNIDFLKSNFKGYQIHLFIDKKGRQLEQPIYVGPELRDRLVELTNNGKQYY